MCIVPLLLNANNPRLPKLCQEPVLSGGTQLLYHVPTVQNVTEIQVFTRRLRRALFHTNLYLQPFGRPVAKKKKKASYELLLRMLA